MTRTRIKICGITSEQLARCAIEAGADAIGLVSAKRSPRYVEPTTARAIAFAAKPFVQTVGLFVDPPAEMARLDDLLPAADCWQWHGSIDAKHLQAANDAGRRIILAMSYHPEQAEQQLRTFEQWATQYPCIGGLIVDHYDATGVGGGTGQSFDWSGLRDVIDRVQPTLPIILAGGLNPDNVAEAIRIVQPYAVDVSSGVESERGKKDPAKIRAFCEAVRQSS